MSKANVVISRAVEGSLEDQALEGLLWQVYVEGGFTDPDVAADALGSEAVRARGHLLVASSASNDEPMGVVIMVKPDDPGRRMARVGEAEMHLLGVASQHRGAGIGEALVEACKAAAREAGLGRMVLWTQPSMHAAQRLYTRSGFVRNPSRDMQQHGRSFLVFECVL